MLRLRRHALSSHASVHVHTHLQAPAEVLERIAGLLEGAHGSITLVEKGDTHMVCVCAVACARVPACLLRQRPAFLRPPWAVCLWRLHAASDVC